MIHSHWQSSISIPRNAIVSGTSHLFLGIGQCEHTVTFRNITAGRSRVVFFKWKLTFLHIICCF